MIAYFQLLRPHQWLKNLLLLFPPFLGGTMLNVSSAQAFILPLISFSAAASGIYIINDVFDLSQDIHHPRKSKRPLPSGQVKMSLAVFMAVALLICSVLFGFMVSTSFLLLLVGYLAVSIAYSAYLKTLPIVEIFCVVSGFLFRLQAGGIAYHVKVSDWLFLSVFLLALFLVSGKRLGELEHSKGQVPEMIRPVLTYYPEGFFQASMYISGSAVLVTYAMYVINNYGNLLVIPLCCFGLLSYLLRVLSGHGGDPTRALLSDPVLLLVGLAWVVVVGTDIYLKI
jgi:decaprenyl-phosphate phosphoribosyltransferase